MFYLVVFGFILFFSICSMYSFRKSEVYLSNVLFYSMIFALIIIGGFRFETGGDWPGYKLMYDGLDKERGVIEPLFQVVINFAKLFGSYQWIFFFCEVIRFVTMAIFLEKNTDFDKKYKCLFVLLYYAMYFFYYDLVIIRQSTAAAIFIFGILKKKNISFKEYLFYVVLATCFHFSSLFLIFMYYPLFKMKEKNVGTVTLLFIVFYFVGLDLLPALLELMLKILPSNPLFRKLYAYTQIAVLATARKITGQSLVYILTFFTVLFDRIVLRKKGNVLYFNGMCLFMFLYFGFPSLSTISTRLCTYFSIFVIFTLIEIISIYKKTVIVPAIIIALCFCFNKSIFFEAPTHVAYNPYQFYWTHEAFGTNSNGLERLNKTNKASMQIRGDK